MKKKSWLIQYYDGFVKAIHTVDEFLSAVDEAETYDKIHNILCVDNFDNIISGPYWTKQTGYAWN